MTRKTCINYPHVDTVLQPLCRGPSHFDNCCKALAQQPGSLLDVTDLYTACFTIELHLKANGITLNKKQLRHINSLLQYISIPMTRNKMPRTRTSSVGYKVKHSPLSPTSTDFGHRLRTRRYTSFVNSYVDTSGDDDSNHIRPIRELRSSSKLAAVKSADPEQEVWESGRPKRTCIKQKRTSADERLVADNKNYYKVEVMTNKLRSSGVPNREIETVTPKKTKLPVAVSEESEDDKGLIVKFRKQRNSQLTRLNNEAENFLFPRKDESSSEEDTDVDTTPVSNKRNFLASDSSSKLNKIRKNEPEEESSMDSTSSETSVRKRRRLTQAEAFILDNQRYYKFETPGSRLRYQGSYLAPVPPKNNGEYCVKQPRNKEFVQVEKPKIDLDELKFSFEVVPKTESWYKTFQRQDVGEECYTCYHYSTGYNRPFLLPYEMGPLPSLDPRACLYAYNQMKKQYVGEAAPSTSAACSTPDSCSADTPVKTDYNSSTGEDTKSSEDSTLESDFTEGFFRKSKPIPKPGPTRRFVSSKNPRKSPRQHASTLAILSSLIQQRKRREMHRSPRTDQTRHNLSAITEEDKELPKPEPDYNTLAKDISDMLSNSVDQLSLLELSIGGEGVDVDVHYKPDVIETLEDYANCKEGPDVILNTIRANADVPTVRKLNRKKKKNRTGWPNKNRRTVFRKEGSDSRDGLAGSEHENSIIDSPSNHADSNEENSEDNNCNNKRSKNVSLAKLSNFIESTITPSKAEGRGNISKINGDVQANKLNGVSDNFELNFKSIGTPRRKEHRESSSDNCAEVVVASVGDKIDCVNVDLAKWENAERVLAAKLRSEAINNDIQFQPIVRVQKLDSDDVKRTDKRGRVSPPPRRTRPRRMPASPKSPRMLRRPRGGWYRERY